MRSPPPSPELLAAIPGITARLSVILAGLAALIARAFLRHPVQVHIVPLWHYIGRTARRFQRVMNHLATGTLRTRKSRPGRKHGPGKPRGFPTTRAWLRTTLLHKANAYGCQLTHLLEQPETIALLAAAPQAARLLRPICHMLGFIPAPLKRTPPPKKRAAAPTRPDRAFHARPADDPPLGPRPPQPLCPRLLQRWLFNTRAAPIPT